MINAPGESILTRTLCQHSAARRARRLLAAAIVFALLLSATAIFTPVAHAQRADDTRAAAQRAVPQRSEPQRWAVILVGLPGDDAHERLFAKTADQWQKWLTESLDFPPQQVLRLPTVMAEKVVAEKDVAERIVAEKESPASSGEAMRQALADLGKKLQPNDTLWVFTLGHGHYDGRRAWWHLAGRDPSDEDFGRWLGEIRCREQVIWLTHSSSGWFVKPLSRPGRIVIAATAADDETNETEFPHALTAVMKLPLAKLDANADAQVSVAEIFAATLAEVTRRFQKDKRLPTEHAQLDDDGDGRGSENFVIKPESTGPEATGPEATGTSSTSKVDGNLAKKTIVPFRAKLPAEALEQPADTSAIPAAKTE